MKHLILVLALLSVDARAQVASGPVEAAAWVGPVASAVGAAGSERVAGLGFASLSALSTIDSAGKLPFLASPQILEPLAKVIQAQGHTPASFAALSTAQKLDVLAKAAVPAEARAAAVADAAAAAVAEPLRVGTYKDAASKVAEARAVAFYLTRERAEQVAVAEAAVAAYKAKHQLLFDAFMNDLHGKIAAGKINASNVIQHDADGWHAADEVPDQRYGTVSELYAARLERIDRGPLGPWTTRETAMMRDTLKNPDVAAALARERAQSPDARAASDFASLLEQRKGRVQEAYAGNPKLTAALARFEKGSPRAKDVRAVQKFYSDALQGSWAEWTGQQHVLASIEAGGNGVPAWKDWRGLKKRIQRGDARQIWTSVGAFFTGQFLIMSGAIVHWPAPAKLAAFMGLISLLVWLGFSLVRHQSFGFDFDAESIDIRFNRTRY